MSRLEVEGLRVRYGAGPWVVDGVGFTVEPGELLVLLGPSGSGKTTTLRALGGFEQPEAGRVALDGRVLVGAGRPVPAQKRGVGFVFQDYALFPHLSVAENIAFGLRGGKAAKRARVDELLKLVELEAFADRRPGALSGGQQQRVALARAVAPCPALVLLDEPFSNLDPTLRDAVRLRTVDFLRRQSMTAVFVTHDQREALSLADRVAVMNGGRIEQIGPPETLYSKPRTAFVASFLGRTNLLAGEASGPTARTPLGPIALDRAAHGAVRLSLRPQHLELAADGCPGHVVRRTFFGDRVTLVVESKTGARVEIDRPEHEPARVGDAVNLRPNTPAVVLDDAESP